MPGSHARRRLTLISCLDASPIPLTEKILRRPPLLQKRILEAIPDRHMAHLSVFNASPLERTLSVRLGLPLYANDPGLYDLGTKSGCREVFREAGVLLPDGIERLRDEGDVVDAIDTLIARNAGLRRLVVKLNDGFSGEGNAIFPITGCPETGDRRPWIRSTLPHLRFEAPREQYDSYMQKYKEMGGVVEVFIEGEEKKSPSCQSRVNALGDPMAISTHDQVLGGPSGRCSWAAPSPPRESTASTFKTRALRWPECSPSAAWSGDSPQTSSRSRTPRAACGTTTPSRSTCAKAARPTRS
ncbi:MAG: hypothetical protein IPN01_31580 [Deltaproteobacteria bacterium]|nr:hypothetical protein [Deltaproteobacteria bacterium]